MPVSLNYLVKRVFWSALIIIGVIMLSYIIIISAPGDPAKIWAGNPRGEKAGLAIQKAREELGLDQPLPIQVLRYTLQVLSGNMGVSIVYRVPVAEVIWRGLTATLELLVVSYIIGISIGVFLGVESALRRGSRFDSIMQSLAILLANAPSFWLGIGLIILLAETIGFTGYGRIDTYLMFQTGFHPITGFYLLDALIEGNLPVFIDVFLRILPPAIVVATYPIGLGLRISRALVAENLNEEYVRAAVAWGVERRIIIWKYAFRGAIPSLTQIMGLAFAYSLVDAMIVEVVFGREGLGSIAYSVIGKSDYTLITGLMVTVTIFYIIMNTLADILQAIIDPRVKL
ncbi:binding-protein-dependent transport systems inner membrane component [Staphylothermus marinus F1]|uniref:Binding-protein-dependent transport systems inner membrane component n=1 Tax=Staphylothermus marinus (strain ATCC 43588 / DSM 3639 / JCM 9404 / F1) TaxID=399550 RepID=A3DL76_STAMF|nr:ABC transporter permease [Staphylothermus marinus]ABN69386.1 binding-protein-dependent transport systems inner membrane component [Staphylothermus marinus F1]